MNAQFPSSERTLELLRDRVEIHKRGFGGIIGVLDASGDYTVAHGVSKLGSSSEINTDTIFGLGCVSKVLTGILCAEMLERGEISLNDPLAEYLPSHIATIGRNGVAITLEHLVTHRAGLPTYNQDPFSPIDRIYSFVNDYVPQHDVGLYYAYSTIGFALLGLALARLTGSPHAALVRERVCVPLGMNDTWVQVPAAAASRIAGGHDAALVPVAPSAPPEATGGYGFHSTASDLMLLLSACLGKAVTPLDHAIRRTMSLRRTGAPGIADIAMAWHVGTLNGTEMFSHDGLSTGHRAFLGVTPASGRAVVALINGIAPIGLTDIGRRLLNADYPLFEDDCALLRPARSAPPTHLACSPQSLRDYVGFYQMTPRVRVEVLLEQDHLLLKLDGDMQRVYPQGEDEFWLPASEMRLDCVVRFERVDQPVTAMVVVDPASTRRLMRVNAQPARVWYGRSAGEEAAIGLERYLGRYQVGDYVLEVRGAGQSLCAAWLWAGSSPQAGTHALGTAGKGTPLPLVYEREHRFFVDADDMDVSITFETDGSSPARAVLCQIEHEFAHGARIPAMIA